MISEPHIRVNVYAWYYSRQCSKF